MMRVSRAVFVAMISVLLLGIFVSSLGVAVVLYRGYTAVGLALLAAPAFLLLTAVSTAAEWAGSTRLTAIRRWQFSPRGFNAVLWGMVAVLILAALASDFGLFGGSAAQRVAGVTISLTFAFSIAGLASYFSVGTARRKMAGLGVGIVGSSAGVALVFWLDGARAGVVLLAVPTFLMVVAVLAGWETRGLNSPSMGGRLSPYHPESFEERMDSEADKLRGRK